MPIRPEHNAYAREVVETLQGIGVRVEVDYADKNMNEKIKFYKTMKDPYILVIGDKEVEERTVAVTTRGSKEQRHGVKLEEFAELCAKQNREKKIDLE